MMKILGLFTGLISILFISAFTKNSVVKNIQRKQEDSVVAKGARLHRVSNQFSFTEGASVDKNGNVFFTDQPNDLWEDMKGGIYFTDPYYQRPYWDRTSPDIKGEKVYYLPKGRKQAVVVADDLLQPNGIVGTPDGKFLYVTDIKDDKTYKYN